MVPKEARDLVLAGAIVSIILNPLAFILMERLRHGPARPPDSSADVAEASSSSVCGWPAGPGM